MWNTHKQGVIRKTFENERQKHNGSRSGNLVTFATDLDDVISTFWEHVFKYLPRAGQTGDAVPVRIVDGQTINDIEVDASMSKPGLQFVHRSTKCNPIHYLRNMGIMGVRNLINKSYRNNILMVCDDCGVSAAVSTTEDNGQRCPKCDCVKTEKCWPDGNSSYKSTKGRRCTECSFVWVRQFVRKCYACGSNNVHTDARVQNGDDSIFQAPSDECSAEDSLVLEDITTEVNALIDRLYDALPADPRDPKIVSRTKDVFNILVRPEASRDMCSKCVLAAPRICENKCEQFTKTKACAHDKIPDPNISCGSDTFSLSKCVNFSKKIGQYHGCSPSLAARRVKKVREYVKRYINQHSASGSCKVMRELMSRLEIE